MAGCVVMEGATVVEVTVRTAALLVVLPAALLTSAVNWSLLSAIVSAGVVYVEEFAPLIIAPFFFHWNVNGDVPVAATLNVAVCPTVIFKLEGWEEMAGATGVGGGVEPEPVPVPLKATEIFERLARVNTRSPEKACAADGLNVTEPVSVWPGSNLTGKDGPE